MHRSMSSAAATTPSSSISRISSASPARARASTCSPVDGSGPPASSDATAGSTEKSGAYTAVSPAATIARSFSDTANRAGYASCNVSATCSATAGPTSWSSRNGGIGKPSGSSACSATSNGVPSSTAAVISPRNRVSSRLTTNAGASLTSTQFFFSLLPTASAVATVASSVAGVRTTSTSGIIATGLKKWKPTRRDGSASPAAISDTDSEDVLVASTQSGLTTASTSAKTCCLTFISSKTASITKSASANADLKSAFADADFVI